MLFHLFEWLQDFITFPGMRVFGYLTFRAVLAGVFSLIISIIIGRYVIEFLKKKLIGESIRDVGPETHKKKKGTPTMGGVIIIAAIVIPTLLWGDLTNMYVLLLLLATLWMGLVGFVDDYIKVFKKDKQGLKGKFKIAGQVGLGLIVGLTMLMHPDFRGAHRHLRDDCTVRANEYLRGIGFVSGDCIVSIDNVPLADAAQNKSLTGADYLVERRENVEGKMNSRIVHILVPEAQRLQVRDELLGRYDIDFVYKTNVPFLKNYEFDYANLAFWTDDKGHWSVQLIYLLMVIFIVTAVSNGVNITDGLDGLAAGTTAIVAMTLALFVYVSGNIIFSRYLNITFIPPIGESVIFCAALVGACIGFLWYNAHPAQVFMGDTGSLALGGAVGVLALMVKKELLLPLICAVYFVENLSVMLQVAYFKYTKRKYGEGRRIFRMSPLHHHFELGGMPETKIVVRFWIVTILLEIIAFATLKLR